MFTSPGKSLMSPACLAEGDSRTGRQRSGCVGAIQTMRKVWLAVVVLLIHFTSLRGSMGLDGRCLSKPTCTECLRSLGCAWCKQKDFLAQGEPDERRCDREEALRKRHCSDGQVLNPQPAIRSRAEEPMGSGVQLEPQNLHLKLRVGMPQSFDVRFRRAEVYPIDLYYLMDLSFSMKDDLKNIRNLGREVATAMKNITSAVRIGFGSFVDKVVEPYVSTVEAKLANPCNEGYKSPCQPAFSFKHVLKLTEDVEEFERKVSKQSISSNLDNPESGFDAIMQVAVCQDDIGWGNATRILVYTSDDTFHLAGDGKLAGIYQPNDGKCHLNSNGLYNKDTVYALSEMIPQSVVGLLEDDSSNVVQLISEACNNLSSSILLEHRDVPPGLGVSYSSHCGDDRLAQGQDRGECRDVRTNQQVNFTVTVTSSSCLSKTESFIIKVQGINEELRVTVETLCDCDCQDSEEQSSQCHGNGTFHCGICSCDSGHTGQRCECETQPDKDTSLALETLCSPAQTNSTGTPQCSGHGSCVCGQCICWGQHRGQHCQCDDISCNRHNNMICGGNGRCDCGNCECFHNYTGPACECSTLTDQCQTSNDGICSHRGQCECNECHCHPGFFGSHCTKPLAPCDAYRACVACMLHESAINMCHHSCGSAKPIRINGTQSFTCQDDTVRFNVELIINTGDIFVYYTDTPRGIDPWIINMGKAVVGIVLLGVIMIIIYRLMLEVSYQRECRRFLKNKENICWEDTQNPLFQEAKTTFTHPMHVLEPDADCATSTFGK
ncbi:integrin beta-7-like isoform X4 [Oncorhynchus tshawytscha]|uniref:integrin beta-7-like isoform X4 n=1 Tax=Oncorhynchus tshawytscha TaxID=74940 RepID=UPI000D09FF7D|nr:integrin beta-7-like isoform X4 [Oncorhynchus tshawytscha]